MLRHLVRRAFVALICLSAAACTPVLSVEEATEQLAQYRGGSPSSPLCDAARLAAFRKVLSDYARAVQHEGREWPDFSGESMRPDWITRTAMAGVVTRLVDPSDFGASAGRMRRLVGSLEAQSHAKAGDSNILVQDQEPFRPLTPAELKLAKRHACSSLVTYGLSLADIKYAEGNAYTIYKEGMQNDGRMVFRNSPNMAPIVAALVRQRRTVSREISAAQKGQ
jgi:hypothetical protein